MSEEAGRRSGAFSASRRGAGEDVRTGTMCGAAVSGGLGALGAGPGRQLRSPVCVPRLEDAWKARAGAMRVDKP